MGKSSMFIFSLAFYTISVNHSIVRQMEIEGEIGLSQAQEFIIFSFASFSHIYLPAQSKLNMT